MNLNFLQANLNHSKVAQDLLTQYTWEERVDVAVLSDPYRKDQDSSSWLMSSGTRRAAIWVISNRACISNVTRDPEFVSARLNGTQVISCYASPNVKIAEFEDLLQRLEEHIRTVGVSALILLAGDLNARSAAWGDHATNSRGEALLALLNSLSLVVVNDGSTPTFARGAGSVIDITATSEALHRRITNWKVLTEIFNHSDHHYIKFQVQTVVFEFVMLVTMTHSYVCNRIIC